MIQHVLAVAQALEAAETAVVLSPAQDEVRAVLGEVQMVEQAEQRGTGHAVLQTREALAGRSELVLVLYGDTPLVRAETAAALLAALSDQTPLALLSAELNDPAGYGRIVRAAVGGELLGVVEEAEADAATLARREVNSGVMAFRADWLWAQLPALPLRPRGEYYLTDLVALALEQGCQVAVVPAADPAEALGVNTQRQLAEANRLAWQRAAERLMDQGVTVLDPGTTYVEAEVEVGPGTVIHPNTHLRGRTRIGQLCEIGPNSTIVDSQIGDRSVVWASVVEESRLDERVRLGPFSHVRPGCHLEADVHLGNFAEAKATTIGRGTQMHHFSYLGDAEVGADVNIGAGAITCNYDGQNKHRTTIGAGAFVGSDSMLVAPLELGPGARTGAGSVVTRDVPAGATVVGVPARPLPPAAAKPAGEDGD
jgi:bifunctional UDP-N-acetylglucosamine pyrophosphorylase/glucosamine-1-phosphate N-acetyltransferase